VTKRVYEDEIITKEFLLELGKSIKFLKPTRALIFGSYLDKGILARDIDLLILSDYFNNYLWQDRFELLDLPGNHFYDLFLYTPDEFKKFLPLTNLLRQNMEKHHLDLEVYYNEG